MKVKEIRERLVNYNPETECILAIDRSSGFEDDTIEYYPIDGITAINLENEVECKDKPKWKGYCRDYTKTDKMVFYVYP